MTDKSKPPEGYYPKRMDTLDGIRWQTFTTIGPLGQYGHETKEEAVAACHTHAEHQQAIGYKQATHDAFDATERLVARHAAQLATKAEGAREALRLLRAYGAITYRQEQEWGKLLIAATTPPEEPTPMTAKAPCPKCHGPMGPCGECGGMGFIVTGVS